MLWIDPVTPEGLVVEQVPEADGRTLVREVGKLGYAIYRYRAQEVEYEDDLGSGVAEAHLEEDHSGSRDFLLRRARRDVAHNWRNLSPVSQFVQLCATPPRPENTGCLVFGV